MLPRNVARMLAADGWIASHPANRGASTEQDSPAQGVVVLSASKAARLTPSPGTAVISIRGATAAETPLSPQYRAVLCLVIADTSEFADAGPDAAMISAAESAAVAAFVRMHADPDTLLLHYHAGVSRSRSKAAAISDIGGLPYRWTVVNDDVYAAVRAASHRDRDTPTSVVG